MSDKQNFKHVRESLKLTQTELAKILDVNRTTVNSYETGRYPVTLKIAKKMTGLAKEKGIDVKLDSFFSDNNEPEKPGPSIIEAKSDESETLFLLREIKKLSLILKQLEEWKNGLEEKILKL